jgi:uncharacterized protein YrzB (UPF0473 family)
MAERKIFNGREWGKTNILDMLMDPDNNEHFLMTDENGLEVEFSQVAVIPLERTLYCILHPVAGIESVEKDEALVFYLDYDDEGNIIIKLETDELKAIEVFEKYYDLLENARKNG